MLKMKQYEAFAKMTKMFGPWNTWGRAEHIAYGLVRGVPYARMERCSNDNPLATLVEDRLWALGAFPEHSKPAEDGKYRSVPREIYDEVKALVVWVKKEPRVKRNKDEAAE